MSDITKKTLSLLESPGRQYAESPIPAWVASATILSQLPSSRKHYKTNIFPKPWAVLLFSSTLAAGGWMTYDHAPIDGAGVTAAWSILYLMVNGTTKSIRPLLQLRNPVPFGITSLVAVNAVTHGYYYSNTLRPKEVDL